MAEDTMLIHARNTLTIIVRGTAKGSFVVHLPTWFCRNVHIDDGDMLTIGIVKIEKGVKA